MQLLKTNMKTRPLEDKRYSITKEFTGAEKAQYVIRFCDDWVDSRVDYEAALIVAHNHKAARM